MTERKELGGCGSALPDGRAAEIKKYSDGSAELVIWTENGKFTLDLCDARLMRGQTDVDPLISAHFEPYPEGVPASA